MLMSSHCTCDWLHSIDWPWTQWTPTHMHNMVHHHHTLLHSLVSTCALLLFPARMTTLNSTPGYSCTCSSDIIIFKFKYIHGKVIIFMAINPTADGRLLSDIIDTQQYLWRHIYLLCIPLLPLILTQGNTGGDWHQSFPCHRCQLCLSLCLWVGNLRTLIDEVKPFFSIKCPLQICLRYL